jgi:hypothetical protein
MLKGSFFGNLFGSKDQRKDDALDLYKKSANSYKLAEEKSLAVEMYMKCAGLEDNLAFKAGYYKEAGG